MPNQEYQQTLAQKVSYTGVGLHSGKEVLMTLCEDGFAGTPGNTGNGRKRNFYFKGHNFKR